MWKFVKKFKNSFLVFRFQDVSSFPEMSHVRRWKEEDKVWKSTAEVWGHEDRVKTYSLSSSDEDALQSGRKLLCF